MRRAQALVALTIAMALDPRAGVAEAVEQHPEVLVVVNGASEISVAIGRYYAARRGVPAGNLVALDIPLRDPTLTSTPAPVRL